MSGRNAGKDTADDLAIIERAHEWYNTLRRAGPDERAAFVEWLKASPRNAGEFLAVTAIYREFDGPDYAADIDVSALLAEDTSNVVALESAATQAPNLKSTSSRLAREHRLRWPSIAAAIGIFSLFGGIWSWDHFTATRFTTALGEMRTIALADGSAMQLNTDSKVRVEFDAGARDIQLLQGEALFTVARDPSRPFRVHSGTAVIQAVGTQFNVYRHLDATTVSVLEGRVAVGESRTAGKAQLLEAGRTVDVLPSGGISSPKPVDVVKVMAWREKRLVFQADRLADIVAEFNRYNEKVRFDIEDTHVAGNRFTGIFDANAPESFARILEDSGELTIERRGARIVVRGASPARDDR